MIKLLLIIFLFVLSFPNYSYAIYEPLSVPNNKYGIHIIDNNDLDNAAKLVNSTGGDWGYVTLVVAENDRNLDKWNSIFAKMRELHLIPLLRLATTSQGDSWRKPELDDVASWSEFLSKLMWVTKNRYIIIFNEPNHAKEWGNIVDPMDYTNILSSFSATLKNKSPDFYILPAGLDSSAPNSSLTMTEVLFLKKMFQSNSQIFNFIDGWTSHSYPNPGFVGKVGNSGPGTLFSYKWELNQIKRMGLTKKLPVFITETGWPHQDGSEYNRYFYTSDQVSNLLILAAQNVWIDKDIVAITPFVLNYQSYPFSNFSWQKYNSKDFYPQYETYATLPKTRGEPILDVSFIKSDVLGVNNSKLKTEEITTTVTTENKKNSLFDIMLKIFHRLPFVSQFI